MISTATGGALAAILPPGAVGVERGTFEAQGLGAIPPLHEGEEELLAGASDRRRREFAEARECAREALRALGAPAGAILAGGDGAPLWPDGVVGSITHKGGYRAAAVARTAQLAGLGIDAEPDARLPEGVLETIASPLEVEQVETLLEQRPELAWDRLLFSAKEAALKAAQPLGAGLAGIRAVEVSVDPGSRSFTARNETGSFAVEGRWTTGRGLILAAVSVPAAARA